MDADESPYRSPLATGDGAIDGNTGPVSKFRWRVIPVTLLSILGPMLFVAALFGTGITIYRAASVRDRSNAMDYVWQDVVIGVYVMAAGALLFVAALLLAKSRWKLGIALAILGVAMVGTLDIVSQLMPVSVIHWKGRPVGELPIESAVRSS